MRILFRLGNENHGVGRADFQWNPQGTLIATAGVNVRRTPAPARPREREGPARRRAWS